MEIIKKLIDGKEKTVLWGAGARLKENIELLKKHCDIVAICDSNVKYQEGTLYELPCINPSQIIQYAQNVVIMTFNEKYIAEIKEYGKNLNIEYCRLEELLKEIYCREEETFLANLGPDCMVDQNPFQQDIIKKYICINVPANVCNLRCSYCYLEQVEKCEFGLPQIYHRPEYIRYQLRREKVGGAALITLCGSGETLLCDKFADICCELLKEGHYLQIVTNTLLTEKIEELLDKAGDYQGHIFFKISFHYEQLKKRKLLEKFAKNVKMIGKSKASYTIELMPCDELIPLIEEIQEFSIEKFGALPHLTIGRDDSKEQKLLTNLTFDEYYKVWSVFDSELFRFKMNYYMCQTQKCHAGQYSIYVDLLTGTIMKCLGQQGVGNLYQRDAELTYEWVNNSCPLKYCYNCHSYATLGDMPHVNAPTYLAVRDRVMENGEHWVKEPMRKFIEQKLYDNN